MEGLTDRPVPMGRAAKKYWTAPPTVSRFKTMRVLLAYVPGPGQLLELQALSTSCCRAMTRHVGEVHS